MPTQTSWLRFSNKSSGRAMIISGEILELLLGEGRYLLDLPLII
jgi:hypothetical protein